jgi:hypothetical protein
MFTCHAAGSPRSSAFVSHRRSALSEMIMGTEQDVLRTPARSMIVT